MVITKPEANVVYELDHNNNIYQVYPLPSTLYSIQTIKRKRTMIAKKKHKDLCKHFLSNSQRWRCDEQIAHKKHIKIHHYTLE